MNTSGSGDPKEPAIEFESIKTRINGEIPADVLSDFINNQVKCPVCASSLDLSPIIENAVSGSLEEMVRLKNAMPLPAVPVVIICLTCKERGGSTIFPIQN